MNEGPARLVVVASYAPSLLNFRGDLLSMLVEREWRVTALAPDVEARVADELRARGVDVVEWSLERSGTNPLRDAGSLLALARVLRRTRPDVVLAYTMKPVLYASLATRVLRDPAMVSLVTGLGSLFVGDVEGDGFRRRAVDGLFRFALARNHRVVFQNPDDRRLFVDRGLVDADRTAQVAGSGVHLDRFAEQPLPGDGPVRFLMIARLLVDKGVREFAEAAARVRDAGVEARFDLVGPLESHPRAVDEADVRGWVEDGTLAWHGGVDDVRPFLRACSVYVLPSYREGTPRSVLEAMATGRAVITTDAPGCRETVVPGVNGRLVPVADARALATAMIDVAADRGAIASMGTESRRLVRERFDVAVVNRALGEILEGARARTA